MKRVAIILGTRPEVIKLAPLIWPENATENISYEIVSTGQHTTLKDTALLDFVIEPKFELNLMTQNQSLAEYGSKCIEKVTGLLRNEKFDGVVVQGDTSTTLFGGLSAFYLGIPIFHVEAGLRTGDLHNPFPEEMNRRALSQFANLHFAPTESARRNLLNENIPEKNVFVTGNTIVDSMNQIISKIDSEGINAFKQVGGKKYSKNILITVHRRENHRQLRELVKSIESFARNNPSVGIWLPVHPNPNVSAEIDKLREVASNVRILDALPYSQFIALLKEMDLVITDSGGVQEEAVTLGKKVLILRDTTERPEGVKANIAKLVKISAFTLPFEIEAALNSKVIEKNTQLYGDGRAARRINSLIEDYLT